MGKKHEFLITEFALAALSEIQGGAILGTAIRALFERRFGNAREILIGELKTGKRTSFEDV